MSVTALTRRDRLHRRGIRLEWFSVVEGVVAIIAGIIAGSVSLVGFGADSFIEVIAASALLWRFRQAGPRTSAGEQSAAEKRALYVVAATFVVLAGYIAFESTSALLNREEPESSTAGLVLAVTSILIMPALAYGKQRTGRELGSEALRADAVETWVCSYLSVALLAGAGLYTLFGWQWADPVGALAMLPVILWQGWETFEDAREEGGGDGG